VKACKSISILLLATTLAWSQSADEVMNRWQKAMYGEGKIETAHMKGRIVTPMGQGETEIFIKDGGKLLVHTVLAGQVETWQGCDGESCYSNDPMGLRRIEGQERDMFVMQNDLVNQRDWREIYASVEYIGEEMMDGKKVYKLQLETEAGMRETNYYDAESGLIHKQTVIAKNPMGEFPVTITYKEYAESGPLTYPKVAEMNMMNMTMTMLTDELNLNIPIPDAKFALPEGL